jgi:hypothetical protein
MAVNGCSSSATPPSTPLIAATPAATAAKPFATVDTAQIKEFTIAIFPQENSPTYSFEQLVFTEAFNRLGIKLTLKIYSLARATEAVNAEEVDGEATRIYEFTANGAHPNHVRVDTPLMSWEWLAYTTKPGIKVEGWQSLKDTAYRVGYSRGVKKSEIGLMGVVPPDKLLAIDDLDEQGSFKMLLADRFDIYVSSGGRYVSEAQLQTADFKGKGIYEAGVLDKVMMYLYVRKKYADLAVKLAATMKAMEAEGLMKQYDEQVKKKYGLK